MIDDEIIWKKVHYTRPPAPMDAKSTTALTTSFHNPRIPPPVPPLCSKRLRMSLVVLADPGTVRFRLRKKNGRRNKTMASNDSRGNLSLDINARTSVNEVGAT